MKRHFADWDLATLDLAIDRFTVGLESGDEAALARGASPDDLQDFERAVAAIHLGALEEVRAPSAEFLGRLEQAGRRQLDGSHAAPAPARTPPRSLRMLPSAGWWIAAALLAVMLLTPEPTAPAPQVLRSALIAQAADLVRSDWTATEDPAAARATGDVVWSAARQEGYMRIRDLEPNDPRSRQFQLWIFDPTRADWEAKPVDGGVFDVPTRGEVVIPIDAKLEVAETSLFAVTIEVPGGVVVSDRERIVLTASP